MLVRRFSFTVKSRSFIIDAISTHGHFEQSRFREMEKGMGESGALRKESRGVETPAASGRKSLNGRVFVEFRVTQTN